MWRCSSRRSCKISKLRDIWVKGEVGNSTRSAAGHSYFTLLDEGAALRCVMFRGGSGEREIETGAAVRAHGYVSLYEARGDLQLIVDTVQPTGDEGDLQRKLVELEKRLRAEGLFEESRKRPIPQFPLRVGVVTSPTGSVWHDIQNVTRRRYPLVELALAGASVQGKEAAPRIVRALNALNEDASIDVIIVARGGGSLEDLWAFNEKIVARAIFGSKAPVVSGVGHETDRTIADLVADVRAPTPSAAAEIVLPDQADLKAKIGSHRRYLNASMGGRIAASSREIDTLQSRLRRGLPDFDTMRLRIDDLMRTTSAHARGSDAGGRRAPERDERPSRIHEPKAYPHPRIRHRPARQPDSHGSVASQPGRPGRSDCRKRTIPSHRRQRYGPRRRTDETAVQKDTADRTGKHGLVRTVDRTFIRSHVRNDECRRLDEHDVRAGSRTAGEDGARGGGWRAAAS